MKIKELLEVDIKLVKAYQLPNGELYATKDLAVQAFVSSKSPCGLWIPVIAIAIFFFAMITLPLWVRQETTMYDMTTIPEFNDAEIAFGPKDGSRAYMTREELGDWYGFPNNPYTNAVNKLFFQGGKLEDHGLRFKDGIDQTKAMRAIRAWMVSWAPKHEIKVGTIAYALSHWCEEIKK